MTHVIKAISYSKPRIIIGADGEAMPSRYVVVYAVGLLTDLAGGGMRKVDEIAFNKELNGFEVRFNILSKSFPVKQLITVPYLPDTEVLYNILEENNG